MSPRPSTNRSRRLRKKLHIGEFQELYFDIRFTTPYNELYLDNFIELLESHSLSCVASTSGNKDSDIMTTSAAVLLNPRLVNGILTVDHRSAVVAALTQCNVYSIISVSDLLDAWHNE